ncbi:MAG: hypothetical protein K0V04_42605 [Deltaproteobacteria bacterium]|nr:hypothetical protein [Deltaproteobacteria bacterium]
MGSQPGCGDDSSSSAAEQSASQPGGATATDWTARLAEPTVADLLAALAQPHATLRDAVGPHRLHTTTSFALVPTTPSSARPALDSPVVPSQAVEDELTLSWGTTAEQGVRLSLTQANDHDRGRDVVVIDETIYVRQAHRGWFHYPRDSDLIEQWLDDAQRSAHDAVQLAAPRLSLHATPVPGEGLDGGPAVEIALALGETRDGAAIAAGPTQAWRDQAQIDAVTGAVRLDTVSGAWLSADIDVSYSLSGPDGQPLQGRLHLKGDVVPGPPSPIQTPTASQPLPQRQRYEQQRRELLDGLAGP